MAKDFKEKIITVNFTRAFDKPVTKRAKSALYLLKKGVTKETRITNIKLTNKVNEKIWENGLFKCHRKLTIKIVKEKDGVRIYLPDEKVIVQKEEKKKRAPQTKQEKVKEKLDELKKQKDQKEDKKSDKEEAPKESTTETKEADSKETKKEEATDDKKEKSN
jgi:ribosomal protein L31E